MNFFPITFYLLAKEICNHVLRKISETLSVMVWETHHLINKTQMQLMK